MIPHVLRIPHDTARYRMIPLVTACYRSLPHDTARYRMLPLVTACYRSLPHVTARYRMFSGSFTLLLIFSASFGR